MRKPRKVPNKLPKKLPRNPAALPAMMRRAEVIPSRAEKRAGEKVDFLDEAEYCNCNLSVKNSSQGVCDFCSEIEKEMCDDCGYEWADCNCCEE